MAVYKNVKTGKWYYKGKAKNKLGEWKDYQKSGFETKKAAKKAEEEFLNNKVFGTTTKLDDVFNDYIRFVSDKQAINTINRKESSYYIHIQPVFGKKRLTSITRQNIIAFRNVLAKTHKPGSVNSIMATFKCIYKHALVEMGLDIQNPFVNVSAVPQRKELFTIWDPNQFKQYLSFVDNDDDKCMFNLLFMTGMRCGEMLALTWNDYDGEFIHINKSYSKGTMGKPKTDNSYRKIKLDQNTKILLDNLKKRKQMCEMAGKRMYIFGGAYPLSYGTLSGRHAKYEKLSGLPHIRLHDFRHSHASYLINKGIPVIAIAQRLGDTPNTILKVYAHFLDNSTDDIMKALNNF